MMTEKNETYYNQLIDRLMTIGRTEKSQAEEIVSQIKKGWYPRGLTIFQAIALYII